MNEKCENCGCKFIFPEGYHYGGKAWHWNDHLCMLALLDSKRILEEENKQLREQVRRFEEFTQAFRDREGYPSQVCAQTVFLQE